MKIYCKLVLDYESKEICSIIEGSLRIDNYQFVKTVIEKNKIISEITSDSFPSLCHTLEDYLECLGIAEKIARYKSSKSFSLTTFIPFSVNISSSFL